MKRYNFFLDIDGTLLPGGKSRLSEGNLAAIRKARELGCKVFINTGRPYCDIDLDIFSDEYFDGICSGGDYAVYHGKTVYSYFMPKTDIREILTELMSGKHRVNFNIGGLSHRYYIGKRMPYWNKEIYVPLSSPRDFDTLYKDDQLQKYVVSESLSPSAEVLHVLEKYFTTVIHPGYTEGFLLGHGKAELIQRVENALGIPHETTVAIGDSLNDVDMLRYAAVSVAMGNAPDEVRSLCDLVTDTDINDGVAKAILRLIDQT